jgi:undecaprenyl-diphosphatase
VDLIQAVVFGVIQGLTEWLPISSTAHIRVAPALLGWPDPGAAFTATIQLGTLLAVLIYFGKDLLAAFLGWCRGLRGGEAARTHEARLGWAIFLGTLPIVVCGIAFERQITGPWRSLNVIAAMLIVMGVVLWIAELTGKRKLGMADVKPVHGLWVGLWQAIALVPGASRSGVSMSGALFAGFDRTTAARFAFLLSVPSVLAAGVKEAYDERHAILGQHLATVAVATAVSFVVGYASIAWLLRYLQTRSNLIFIVYRIALGVALIVLVQMGVLQATEPQAAPPGPAEVHQRTDVPA